MKKEDVIECIDYFGAEVSRLKKDIKSVAKFNIDTSKTEKTIQNYQEMIQQFNRRLINSKYEINQDLLAIILQDFIIEADLLRNTGLLPRKINLICNIFEEFKRNNAKKSLDKGKI